MLHKYHKIKKWYPDTASCPYHLEVLSDYKGFGHLLKGIHVEKELFPFCHLQAIALKYEEKERDVDIGIFYMKASSEGGA